MMERWFDAVASGGCSRSSDGDANAASLPDPPREVEEEGEGEGDVVVDAVSQHVRIVEEATVGQDDDDPAVVGGEFQKSPGGTGGGGYRGGSTVAVSMCRVPQNELPTVTDHFSLSSPSSVVRFRRSNVRVYERAKSQFVLEERATRKRRDGGGGSSGGSSNNNVVRTTITVKSMKNGGNALSILRATYTLVTVFVCGFLFIFSLELLLFLFMDLATEIGYTHTQGRNVMAFVSVLLSVPAFVYALGSAMTMAGRFVSDTWSGHTFLRTFGGWSNVVTDWISFVMYLGVPLLTAAITLLMKNVDWWSITSLTWFVTVLLFWGFFAGCVLYYEVSACLYLTEELGNDDPEVENADGAYASGGGSWTRVARKLRSIVINGETSRLSGVRRDMYLIDGDVDVPDDDGDGTFSASENVEPHVTRTSPYSRFTTWRRLDGCLFTSTSEPGGKGGERFHTLDEARDVRSFVTDQSWSLEKLYCRNRESRAVAVIGGPSALTRSQVRSSLACTVLGNVMVFLILVGVMVWFDSSPSFVVTGAVIIVLCFVPGMMASCRVFRMYRDVTMAKQSKSGAATNTGNGLEEGGNVETTRGVEEESKSSSEAMFQVWETYRITRPRPQLCMAVFVTEIIFLYIWPLLHLCLSGNVPGATLFALLGLFCGVRYYLDPSVVLRELGNFGTLGADRKKQEGREHGIIPWTTTLDWNYGGELYDASTDKEWKAKSRLSEIVGSISSGRSRGAWNGMFMVLVAFFVLVVVASVAQGGSSDGRGGDFSALKASDKMTLVSSDLFRYEAQPNLPYPTCQLKKGLEIPTTPSRTNVDNTRASSSMIDYAFVANVAYVKSGRGNDTSQFLLDGWFGEDRAYENVDVVRHFRTTAHPEYVDSVASYKLITFTAAPGFGVVAIRGTSNVWDLMADAQLWLAAGLFQGLREVLPLGGLWTPILHRVVRFVSALQTSNIERVSFYKETTKFVEYLQRSGNYTSIQITGHSLGGGLALITGSQTNTPAVGLSAPNAMLSRETFDPPLTEEQLNTLTFNIVPTRDIIPMLDDKANLYQNIECRGGYFYDCHTGVRSLCEAMYTCGSQDRPVICDCVKYGYPPPTAIQEGANFTQACQTAAEEASS